MKPLLSVVYIFYTRKIVHTNFRLILSVNMLQHTFNDFANSLGKYSFVEQLTDLQQYSNSNC